MNILSATPPTSAHVSGRERRLTIRVPSGNYISTRCYVEWVMTSNRILLCRALGIRPERILALGQDYAALSVLERDPSGWALRLLNHREPGG